VIFFDTETTGFPRDALPLDEQPRIIEIALVKVDTLGEVVARFESLVNPGMVLPEEIVRITKITDAMLRDAPTFPRIAKDLVDFFLGERELVAHNVFFDVRMLALELERMNWLTRFPWPHVHIDTQPMSGRRKLNDWAKALLGDSYSPQAHRAMGDVGMLMDCWRAHHDK
jgi:DNA polymerase III epsilon subunit-like protein